MAGVSVKDGQLHLIEGKRFSDIDLILIRDGRLTIGEVKSDTNGFSQNDFAKLRAIALDLRPDELIVAAVGEKWEPKINEQIGILSNELAKAEIVLTPLLLQWWSD